MKTIKYIRINVLIMLLMISVSAAGTGVTIYSSGRAKAVPTSIGKVYVYASADGKDYTGQGTSDAYQSTELGKQKKAKEYTYYFSADSIVGYTFVGWFQDESCISPISPKHSVVYEEERSLYTYQFSTTITAAESITDASKTYWAYWTANNYTVTLNNHGATTSGTTSVGVTYDATTGISSNITPPTKTDYTFDGYYTGENGTGTMRINASGVWQAASGFIEDGKWKNAGNVTLHAKWIANSKTITLDNQGADDGKGGTASIEVFYNASTNLTGKAVSTLPIKSGYTFEGYFTGTNGSGTKIFDRSGYTVESASDATYTYTDATPNWKYDGNITLYAYWKQNQTITWTQDLNGNNYVRSTEITLGATAPGGTVTYTATSNAGTVQIVNTNKLTCLTAGSVTVTAHQSGNHDWNEAPDVSQTFTIVEHAITTNPTASGITYEQTLASSILSGGVTNVGGSWSWDNNSIRPNYGTTNQVAVFTPSSSPAFGASDTLHCLVPVTVAKATPEVTCTIGDEYDVDDAAINLETEWTREGDGARSYSIVSFTPLNDKNNGAAGDPIIEGNRLYLRKAGTLVIQMDIAEGTNYNARTGLTKTITINKRENTISINGTANSYSTEMYMESTLAGGITLSATNTDYSGSAFVVTAGAGAAVGSSDGEINALYTSLSATTGKIESNHNTGDATWTIYQPENYKYEEASATLNVTVKLADAATDCYVLSEVEDWERVWHGNTCHQHTWAEENAAGVVSFKVRHDAAPIDNYIIVQENLDGWKDVKRIDDYGTTEVWRRVELSRGATGVRFFGSGSVYNYILKVSVTRAQYLESADTITIDRTSTNNPIYPSDGTGVGTLTIDYSLASGGDLHIYNDNPEKFTLSQTTISSVDCKTGTATINLSYESAEAGTDYAHLVIYNKVYRKEVTVTGITAKRNQVVNWEVGNVIRLNSEIEDAAWVITGNTVSYESLNPSVIAVVDGKLVAQGVGSAEIVARADGSGDYKDAYDTKTIEVTNDLIQSIVWTQDQDLLRMNTTTRTSLILDAYATSDVKDCTTNGARPITYASSNESVVRIEGTNRLVVVGVGRATVTATQDGSSTDADGHKYMTVSEAKIVVVRDPNAPCINYQYQQGEEKTEDFGISMLNPQEKDVIKQTNLVEPDSLILEYRGMAKHWGAGDYYNGKMTVNEFYDDRWHLVDGGDLGTPPSNGSYGTFKARLNRKTTEVSVHVTEGRGYHMVKGMKIGIARYIESGNELSVFESKVGQQVSQKLTINYSNIVGPITLQLGHEQSNFSLSQTLISGECGDKDTKEITVYYTPSEAISQERELLTISDGVTSLQITLEAQATVTQRYVSWDIEEHTNVYTVETVNLTAQALATVGNTPAGSVYYAKDGTESTTGNLSGSTLTFSNAGVAKITAMATADAKYNTPTGVTKFYHAALTPTTISTLPVLAAVTSGAAIGDIELNGWQATNTVNGGVVEGTLAITSVDLINAGTNTVTLTFTPANTAMYSGCTGTTTITVNKVTSTATPSASNIIYGQTLNSSTLTNTGTEGTWTWKTADNTAIFPAGTHEGLAVHFTPSNPNYTELDGTVTLTVEKADPEVTAQATAITYGQAISASELSTATGDISGSWEWAVDEEQVLSVGDHVLKANFTSANANYNDLSNVDVTLTVNKAASEATPSAAAIKEGQKVSESVLTNSGTAGTWAWDAAVADNTPAAGTYNYTVHFTPENANYTELTTTVQLKVNVPVYNFINAKGDGNWDDPYNWEGGSVPDNNSDVIISGNMTIDDSRTIGGLTIEDGASVQVVVSGNLTVTGDSEDRDGYGDLVIANGGEVNVTGTLNVHDLVIASKSCTDGSSISGQLTGESNITNVDGDVYIDITLVEGALDDSQWYGFTVPFEVDAEHGVYRYENGNVVGPLTWGNQYDIANYDSNKRYNTGKGWQYYRGTLNPGEFYYITLDGTYNVYRFKKKASSAISSGNTKSLNLYGANPASKDANWNPVGNPTLTYAITDYNGYVQIYQNGQSAYKAVPASEATFVVGCPFFIQAAEAGTLTLNEGTKTQLYAPARGEEKAFNISMQAETGGYADNIYLNTSDEADGTYRVGHDLLKAGTSKLVPQLWIAQGEDKLCVNEAELNNNNAYATLGLYAPKTGNYVLDIVDAPQDATLYLTYDGTVIWNLSESAYTLSLMKGTTSNYGLQLVREARNTATDVEQVGSETQIQKFIHNGVLYINKDGVLYDAMGKKVK